jgi:DnaK suppressor protein
MAHYNAAAVRQRLNVERAHLEQDIYDRTLGAEAVVPVDPLLEAGGVASHEADDADAVSDHNRNQAIIRNSRSMLAQVQAALIRLDAGTYGICERCGHEIGARRLEALPYATLCISCQEAVERQAPSR